MNTQGYKNLIAWQKAIELTKEIYKATDHFPNKELYGLTSQMRRAVVSIPSNIAEGFRRKTTKEYENFVRISFGSASELETQLIIAEQVGYLSTQERLLINDRLQEVLRLVNALASALRKKWIS